MTKNKQYALVTHYSFSQNTPVWLFDTFKEATDELEKQFKEEVRIDTEENGHVIGEDMEIKNNEDWSWASITIWWDDNEDVTEWSIGDIRN